MNQGTALLTLPPLSPVRPETLKRRGRWRCTPGGRSRPARSQARAAGPRPCADRGRGAGRRIEAESARHGQGSRARGRGPDPGWSNFDTRPRCLTCASSRDLVELVDRPRGDGRRLEALDPLSRRRLAEPRCPRRPGTPRSARCGPALVAKRGSFSSSGSPSAAQKRVPTGSHS